MLDVGHDLSNLQLWGFVLSHTGAEDAITIGFLVEVEQVAIQSLVEFEYFLQDGDLAEGLHIVYINLYLVFSCQNFPNQSNLG